MKTSLNLGKELIDAVKAIVVTEAVKLDEKKVVVGSLEHMTHALHGVHTGQGNYPGHYNGQYDHPDYSIHKMSVDLGKKYSDEEKKNEKETLGQERPPSITHYLLVHKNTNKEGHREAHHFSVGLSKTHFVHDVKHHGRIM